MADKNDKTNISDERIGDTTMYGEFISSLYQWITPDRLKNKARYFEEITQETGASDADVVRRDKKTSN